MPLIDPVPKPPVIPVETPVKVTPIPYQGVVVNTKYVPASSLLRYVEGSSWTVNYYSQVLNANSALAGQSTTVNPIYQQYKLINELEIKVTSPLTTSQDPNSASMLITGSANVYPCIIPNVGDMFVADIGDGREGIFRITVSERKSVFKDTIHAIEYQLIDYATPERLGDLNIKVVDTVLFVKDFLQYGQNPLLRTEDYSVIVSLQGYYFEMVNRYFKTFISNEYKTLLVPGQTSPIYDHFLTKAVMSFFTTTDTCDIRNIRILNVDCDQIMKATTIWDMLKNRDRKVHKFCIRKTGLVSVRTFTKNPMMEGIYHSGITSVVYPKDPMLSVDYQIKYLEKALSSETLLDTPSLVRNLNDLIGGNGLNGLTLPETPPIKPVLVDDYYVLSQAFYDRTDVGQSLLEICVNNYLDNKAQDNVNLLTLCTTSHAWNQLEQFYYLPILMVLIKSSIKSI